MQTLQFLTQPPAQWIKLSVCLIALAILIVFVGAPWVNATSDNTALAVALTTLENHGSIFHITAITLFLIPATMIAVLLAITIDADEYGHWSMVMIASCIALLAPLWYFVDIARVVIGQDTGSGALRGFVSTGYWAIVLLLFLLILLSALWWLLTRNKTSLG